MKDQTIRPPVSAADAKRQEQARVKAMIERDRQDRMREIERAAAEIELASGKTAYVKETVIEPTAEWFQHGDAQEVSVDTPDRTAIAMKTVRRVRTPIVARLHTKGHIGTEELKACLWYRMVHEYAGLEGRFSSSRFNDTPASASRGSGEAAFDGHIPMTEQEAMARRYFREARSRISANSVVFFDKVVLHDLPITRASRFLRTKNTKILRMLRYEIGKLIEYCKEEDVSLQLVDRF
jgi:hypothetical protein